MIINPNDFFNMFNITQKMFKEIEEYISQYVSSQFDKETVEDLSVKISLPVRGQLVNIELYSLSKNTIVVYDTPFIEFLMKCSTKTIYPILDEKISKMIHKLQTVKVDDKLQTVYIDSIL